MGLFSLLNHYKLEQIPFTPSKEGKLKPNQEMKFGDKTFTWGEIDRWSFDDDTDTGTPPDYNRYTLFTLAESFQLFWIIIFLQFLAVYMVKVYKSNSFREANNLDRLIHATENMNIAYPFQDFDILNGSAGEHRKRFEEVNKEVIWTMMVNLVINILMLGPLWYTAFQVISRHELLQMTIGVKEEEIISYDIANYLPLAMTTAVVLTSLLAIASFLVYNYKFHPWSILIQDPAANTAYPEEEGNIEYLNILIPVPYDPKIPGVRYIDTKEEEMEEYNTDILDDIPESIELRNFSSTE